MRARALRKAAVAAGIIGVMALVVGLSLVRRGAEREVALPGERRADAGSVTVEPVTPPREHPAAFEETVAEEAPPLELHGTLVLIDAEGAEHPEEDGEFLMLRSASGEEPIGVAVTKGTWRAPWGGTALPAELHVMRVQAGGAEAEVEGRIPVSQEGEVHIRASWLPPAPVLEVIGKDTGAGLGDVKVVAGTWVENGAITLMAASPHSGSYGPELTIAEGEDSPLVLERSLGNARRLQGSCQLWARAPGYAWGAIDVDFSRGGQHILALERDASLEVVILSRAPPGTNEDPAVLRIRRAPESKEIEGLEEIDKFLAEIAAQGDAKQALDEQISSIRETREQIEAGCQGDVEASVIVNPAGLTRIEGLPARSFAACVEIGSSLADPLVLGSSRAELSSGETTRITITLADPEPMVAFEGTLEVPEPWPKVDLSVNVELLDKSKVSRGQSWQRVEVSSIGPGIYAWSAGRVPPGRYQVIVSSLGLVRVFDVPPAGKRDALIRVGAPVEVRVKVLDAGTGESIEDARVSFSPEPAAEGASVPTVAAEVDRETGDHIFTAPVGRVRIQAESDPYLSGEETLDLGRDGKAVTLRLRKGCGALLTLDGWMPPDRHGFTMSFRLEPLEGPGQVVEWQTADGGAMKLTVSVPGLYELRVPRVEGLAPVEPIRIRIPPDRYVEQTITLRRE